MQQAIPARIREETLRRHSWSIASDAPPPLIASLSAVRDVFDTGFSETSDAVLLLVCGARNLGEALRRVDEGAAMIRTKGEAGSGNIVEAVTHMKTIVSELNALQSFSSTELKSYAEKINASYEIVKLTKDKKSFPYQILVLEVLQLQLMHL